MKSLPLVLVVLVGCGGDAETCARWVLEAQVTNARDLGGWAVSGGTVRCGTIYRGGTLAGLTDSDCSAFAALGIKTILDLRDTSSQNSAPPPACVTAEASLVQAPMPKLLPDTAETYLALLDEGASIRQVFDALGVAGACPAYLHCEIGRARASFVTTLILLALGAERPVVMEEFGLSNDAGVEVAPAHLEAVLDEIELRGGITAFLQSVGVSASALEELRRNAVEEP